MRAHEIADVDIVANAGAIRRRVVGAEDLELGPQAERGFHRDLDEMGSSFGRLPGAAERVGTRDVEVTKNHVAQPVSAGSVAQHDFDHKLGRTIRRGRHRGRTHERGAGGPVRRRSRHHPDQGLERPATRVGDHGPPSAGHSC